MSLFDQVIGQIMFVFSHYLMAILLRVDRSNRMPYRAPHTPAIVRETAHSPDVSGLRGHSTMIHSLAKFLSVENPEPSAMLHHARICS
jgi:hypothetical protein